MKTIEQHFADWESNAFGYGYGTGEPHILAALHAIAAATKPDGTYDYRDFEAVVGPTVAWLLINRLCQVDAINYGSSPRFGWWDAPHGIALLDFLRSHTTGDMLRAIEGCDAAGMLGDYVRCFPELCQCGCDRHPFWRVRGK